MLLECVSELKESDILSEDLMIELFAIDNNFDHEKKRQEIESRAAELKIKSAFNKLYSSYKKDIKKELADRESFTLGFRDQPELCCGVWRTSDDGGIWTLGDKGRIYACTHPIYPAAILVNIETKTCKVDIMFKVRNKWSHVLVDRKTIANRTTIINLANNGIRVTSENAGALVQFLSDIESLNEDAIPEMMSTSRLGWVNGSFMPYEQKVIFDNEDNLRTLFEAIHPEGSFRVWKECVMAERQNKRIEVLIYLAASFASVLVEPLGILPFVVDLWGGTGKGKTVALMMACSIWADPNEGEYITDAKSTQNSIEIRLGALNSLPMIIDDMAQIKNKTDDFANLIYMLCSGSSKGRATKEGGIKKTYSWKNCSLTNAEHSLISETMQGGAVNRVIDVECANKDIFQNAHEVADTIRHNFGYAGQEFIECIREMSEEELQERYKYYYELLTKEAEAAGAEKEQKQLIPMAAILAADELSEKFVFKDDIRLDLKECLNLLKNKNDVSEGIRTYNYLIETIWSNSYRFEEPIGDLPERFERWGKYIGSDKVAIIGRHFDRIITEANSQPKAFLSWAKAVGIIDTDKHGNPKKNVDIDGQKLRSVVILREWNSEEDEDEWIESEDDTPFT